MTIRGNTRVSNADIPHTVMAAIAICDGTGPMNLRLPVPSEPLDAAATTHINPDNMQIAKSKVTTSRHLTTNEREIGRAHV